MLFKEDDFLENLIMEKLKQEEEAKLDEKRRVLGASNPAVFRNLNADKMKELSA